MFFHPQIIQTRRWLRPFRETEAGRSTGRVPVRKASSESGLFLFPFARTVPFARGALRTDRTDMKEERPLRLRMLSKQSWAPRNCSVFETTHQKKGKERTVHSTFPVTMSHKKWSILYLFFYTCSKFLSPRSNKSYLFGGGFSQNDEWIWSLHILSFVNIWRYPELKTKSIIVTCELSGDSL